jgi:predicted PurR-regulated permease PerM
MGPTVLQLASTTGKQAWLWETTVVVVGVLIVLNLLLFVAVYGRRFRELLRGRLSARFRKECDELLNQLASGAYAGSRTGCERESPGSTSWSDRSRRPC